MIFFYIYLMRTCFFILIACFLTACTSAEKLNLKNNFSAREFNSKVFNSTAEKSSVFGRYFFPQGDLRALVIYVDFEEEFLDPEIHDDLRYWPLGEEFPQHNEASIVQADQSLIWGYQQASNFKDFDENATENLDNLSAFFYQMSAGKFRFYFETLKHPKTEKAISIKIDPREIPSSASGRNELNKRVFEKIREIYPENYDWSRFDSRKNHPNYQPLSKTDFVDENAYADHELDFVIMLFRNSPHWNPHPNGSTSGIGWRKAIMGTGTNEIVGYDGETPIKVSNQGIRVFNTHRKLHEELEIILHEIGHAMLSLPHYNRANKAEGNYLFYPYGWGMMDSYSKTMSLANAWERWYAGWTEITHDLNSKNVKDSTYVLQDYLRQNESMRIQLPDLEDEFLWIEYRKKESPFYGRPQHNFDRYGEEIQQQRLGVFAFTEKVARSRAQTFSTNSQGTNGIKVLYGKGNFDYVVDDFYLRHYAWNNEVLSVDNHGENPYGGQNEAMFLRDDYNKNGKIERKTGNNGAGGQYIDGHNVYEIEQEMVRGHYLPNAPITQRKISAFTNPPIVNFQPMDWKNNQLAPVILHSLSIEFSKNQEDNLIVKVNYEDGVIEEDFRMTGPVVLPSGQLISIQQNTTLLLNKSQTLNRTKAVEGDFIENTSFKVEADGKLQLNENSTWKIEQDSKVYFDAGSQLQMKANSQIELDASSSIEWEDEVDFKIHPSAQVKVNDEIFNARNYFGK